MAQEAEDVVDDAVQGCFGSLLAFLLISGLLLGGVITAIKVLG